MPGDAPEIKAAFEGWAVLELMGHRKLGGFVQEATIAGGAFLRIDVPSDCEGGPAASWCPEHGTCTCPADQKGANPACPLHSSDSQHGEESCEIAATQFYAPGSIYCITPTTEKTARALARANRPAPVHRFELPAAPTRPDPIADLDDEDDHDDEEGDEG